jgi:hypothetical protein
MAAEPPPPQQQMLLLPLALLLLLLSPALHRVQAGPWDLSSFRLCSTRRLKGIRWNSSGTDLRASADLVDFQPAAFPALHHKHKRCM